MKILAGLINQATQIKSRAHRAAGASQDVIKEQGRYRDLGGGATHRLADDLVHAAAHEHAAALDVYSPHGVGEEHDGQDEPWRRLADCLLRNTADIVCGRTKVTQD